MKNNNKTKTKFEELYERTNERTNEQTKKLLHCVYCIKQALWGDCYVIAQSNNFIFHKQTVFVRL